MDPLTHTFVGASLSASGLHRRTPLASATLVLAVNAPDVDIVAQFFGSYTALAWRRGITHGIPALILWPLALTAAVMAWDRWVRRRTDPLAQPARPLLLAGLAAIGVLTHPVLDSLNTYGMRWWMPFRSNWIYGDAVFIIDPWVWLILGGGLFLLHSARFGSILFWVVLAGAMSVLVLGSGTVPGVAKLLWSAGLVGWAVLRAVWGRRMHFMREHESGAQFRDRTARWTLATTTIYIGLMIAQNPVAEYMTLAAAESLDVERIQDVMVGPAPANPFGGEVVLRTAEGYYRGSFSWIGAPRLQLELDPLPSHPRDEIVRAAEAHPDARNYMVWSRFPWYSVSESSDGWTVRIGDVRYMHRSAVGSLAGVTIRLDRNLRLLEAIEGGPPSHPDPVSP